MTVSPGAMAQVVEATTRSAPPGHPVGLVRTSSMDAVESSVLSARDRLKSFDASPHEEVVRLTDRPARHGAEYRVYGDCGAGVALYVTVLVR